MNGTTTPRAGDTPVEETGEIVAWDYYHRRLMGAPGETRHHIYWVSDYVGRDGKVTGDLAWLLDAARRGKEHVEAPRLELLVRAHAKVLA